MNSQDLCQLLLLTEVVLNKVVADVLQRVGLR
jgi:hypothetical protein